MVENRDYGSLAILLVVAVIAGIGLLSMNGSGVFSTQTEETVGAFVRAPRTCTNDPGCSFSGKQMCVGGTMYKICKYRGSCLKWTPSLNCPGGGQCKGGRCACADKCGPSGKKECTRYKTCVRGSSGCLEWNG